MVYIHWYSFGISRTGDDLNHAESDQKKGGVRQKKEVGHVLVRIRSVDVQ